MNAQDFKFKVTNTKTGESAIISLMDLQGYEGEDNGVFIYFDIPNIPESLEGKKVSNKSGHKESYIDLDVLDFEYI